MPPEAILAFDTSGQACDVALLIGGEFISKRFEPMTKGQAERLAPLVSEVLSAADMCRSDLTAIGVGIGPGNFTGVRISVAMARGMALGLGISAIGVTSFEAVVFGAYHPVMARCPAPRGSFHIQQFTPEPKTPEIVSTERAEALSQEYETITRTPETSLAPAIARIARQRYRETTERPAPLYLRPADAAPSSTPAPLILT